MMMYLPDYVRNVMSKLNEHGYECYVVGGAVRSSLLDLPVHDYDLTTNALPEQTKEVFKDYRLIETGIKHGTVTVISDHIPLEITTYRKESEYKDHRHPDAVEFTSALQEDCARRDFTVNALCYHPNSGIQDFYNGQQDLQDRLIRCIRDPHKRFEEDALRILRAIRFAARLNFAIEDRTAEALHECRDLLKYISIERIHEETDGILLAPGCSELLKKCRDVLEVYIPEFSALSPEVFEKTADSLSLCVLNPAVRMAVFLEKLEPWEAEQVIQRMKYSNADRKLLHTLLKHRNDPVSARREIRHLLSSIECTYEEYLSFRCACDMSVCYEEAASLCRTVLDEKDCISLKQMDLSGKDLASIGIRGKEISLVLGQLLSEVMDDVTANRKENLLARAEEIHFSTL